MTATTSAPSHVPERRRLAREIIDTLGCREQVEKLLREGLPATRVARLIQDHWGEARDVETQRLSSILTTWRKQMGGDAKGAMVAAVMPELQAAAVEETITGLDVLAESAELYGHLKKRLLREFALEDAFGGTLPGTHKEIKLTLQALQQHNKMAMDLGVNKRHLGALEVVGADRDAVSASYGDDVAAVLEDPHAGRLVMDVADDIFTALAKAMKGKKAKAAEAEALTFDVAIEVASDAGS